jgi:hypothetical protein
MLMLHSSNDETAIVSAQTLTILRVNKNTAPPAERKHYE